MNGLDLELSKSLSSWFSRREVNSQNENMDAYVINWGPPAVPKAILNAYKLLVDRLRHEDNSVHSELQAFLTKFTSSRRMINTMIQSTSEELFELGATEELANLWDSESVSQLWDAAQDHALMLVDGYSNE